MSDWPLSPLPNQRKQQLEVRRQEKEQLEAKRAQQLASVPTTPFSPAKFIRSTNESATTTTDAGLTSRVNTPRVGNAAHYSIRYEMGYSNTSNTVVAAGSPARQLIAAHRSSATPTSIRRGSDSVAASARKEPAAPITSQTITVGAGASNTLGSPFRSSRNVRKDLTGASLGRVGESTATKFDAYNSSLNTSKHTLNSNWNSASNLRSTTPKRVPATNARIQKTADTMHTQLQKHLNELLGLKYRCEVALDAMAKEFSVLSNETTEAEHVAAELGQKYKQHETLLGQWRKLPSLATESPSHRHQENRLAEIASRDPHRAAFKPRAGTTTTNISSAVHQPQQQQTHRRPDSTAFVGLTNTDKALHYGPVLLKEIAFLKQAVDKCRQLLSDTSNISDKMQHLSMLIDVATNVDLVCLGQKADNGEAIVVTASPAFPKLALSDFDDTENEAAALTSYCTRAAADLRKTVHTAIAGNSKCYEAVVAAMRLGVKCADARQAECQRQIEEIDRDTLLRVQRHLDDCLQEEAQCEERMRQTQRILDIRSTALSHNVFGDRGGNDAVSQSAIQELHHLRQRLQEIQSKKESLLLEYDQLQTEREELVEAAETATIAQALCDEIEQQLA